MRKKIFAGKGYYGIKKVLCYFIVELKENSDKKLVLAITGDIVSDDGEYINFGQCIDTIAQIIPTDKNKRIEAVWKRWHLNDLHAGCIHQREFEKEPYEAHKDHVCQICNYKYGTSWIYEELPEEVIKEVKSW